jgi:hypothetical protein
MDRLASQSLFSAETASSTPGLSIGKGPDIGQADPILGNPSQMSDAQGLRFRFPEDGR